MKPLAPLLTVFCLLFLTFACKLEKGPDELVGVWYVQKDGVTTEFTISKEKDIYVVDMLGKKLLANKVDDLLEIDVEGRTVKALLTSANELVIDGETATKNKPQNAETAGLFDTATPAPEEGKKPLPEETQEVTPPFGNASISSGNVIFRADHSTQSNNLGKFKNGERILILDEYSPDNSDEAIINEAVKLKNEYGKTLYTLSKGKAVQILSTASGYAEVYFDHPEYGRLYAEIESSKLEYISGDKWYKVKRENGKSGWVFSKFVNR